MSEQDYIPVGAEDIEHEREKLLGEARLQKAAMVRLLEDRNFKMYVEHLQKQIDRRLIQVLQMPLSADDIIQKTYCMGEMAGMKIALDLPQVLIVYAQTSIDSARVQEEMEQGNGQAEQNNTSPRFDNWDDDELDPTDEFYANERAP